MNIRTAYAEVLPVDEERLVVAQSEGAVLGSGRIMLEAFETDVRSLIARLRAQRGVAAHERRAHERGGTASVETAYGRT